MFLLLLEVFDDIYHLGLLPYESVHIRDPLTYVSQQRHASDTSFTFH